MALAQNEWVYFLGLPSYLSAMAQHVELVFGLRLPLERVRQLLGEVDPDPFGWELEEIKLPGEGAPIVLPFRPYHRDSTTWMIGVSIGCSLRGSLGEKELKQVGTLLKESNLVRKLGQPAIEPQLVMVDVESEGCLYDCQRCADVGPVDQIDAWCQWLDCQVWRRFLPVDLATLAEHEEEAIRERLEPAMEEFGMEEEDLKLIFSLRRQLLNKD
jgi:hypothetical protein